MDARVVVEAMEANVSMVDAQVTTVINVDDLVIALESLFDVSTTLAPLRNMGNSVTAVAPDFDFKGGMSALAVA